MVDSVAERVSEIEMELLKKCNKADMKTQVKYLVGEELKVLKETLTNKFHAELAAITKAHKSEAREEVRDEIRRDHDRQRRRLNIIAHGIPELEQGTSQEKEQADIMFISEHLKTSYKLPEFHLTNVKRLIPKNNQIVAGQQPQRIAPVIFTVPT